MKGKMEMEREAQEGESGVAGRVGFGTGGAGVEGRKPEEGDKEGSSVLNGGMPIRGETWGGCMRTQKKKG